MRRALAALIGVVQQLLRPSTPPQGHHERIGDKLGSHVVVHRSADHWPREQVEHDRIRKASAATEQACYRSHRQSRTRAHRLDPLKPTIRTLVRRHQQITKGLRRPAESERKLSLLAALTTHRVKQNGRNHGYAKNNVLHRLTEMTEFYEPRACEEGAQQTPDLHPHERSLHHMFPQGVDIDPS